MKPLNLFYEEPANDRWVRGDHWVRNALRPLLFWRRKGGAIGYLRVFLNLRAGLDRLKIPYRVNDYRYARLHPEELVCVLGKPHVLDKGRWKNPLMIGTALYSHPSDDPTLLTRLPVRRILVQCEWMKKMCEPAWGDRIHIWPVGIDTDLWAPKAGIAKDIDVLIYDKIRWDKEEQHARLVDPLRRQLEEKGLRVAVVRYGFYAEREYRERLQRSRSMIFICEHETQGLACHEALSCGVPVFAWDAQGFWVDRDYYPHRVQYSPVTSVPYWDDRCGMTFKDLNAFVQRVDSFLDRVKRGDFHPRAYILENLTLEMAARRYAELAEGALRS